jgi:hypothetical protein
MQLLREILASRPLIDQEHPRQADGSWDGERPISRIDVVSKTPEMRERSLHIENASL